ncbi:MAG: hypothetical protein ACJATI_004543 [Halioglobus sp.]|jgi:hypothetical protein
MIRVNDFILLTGIFSDEDGVNSQLIKFENELNYTISFIDDVSFCKTPIIAYDEKLYYFATDRKIPKSFRGEILPDGQIESVDTTIAFSDTTWAISSLLLEGAQYNTYIYYIGDKFHMGISKYDLESGELEWTRSYNPEAPYALIYHQNTTEDGNLLVSHVKRFENEFTSFGYVMKINPDGDVLWESEAIDTLAFSGKNLASIELSDGRILTKLNKEMWFEEFLCCLQIETPAFIWRDANGIFEKQYTFKTPRSDYLYISKIEAGRGDYFYSYGQIKEEISEVKEYYGFITKYDNDGNEIWTHRYRHPDFEDGEDRTFLVRDIIEEEDGSITAMGAIDEIGVSTDVWIFNVNEYGCFNNEECPELQIFTATNDLNSIQGNLKIYPNPSKNIIKVVGLDLRKTSVIEIYSMSGNKVYTNQNLTKDGIDISFLPKGVYTLKLMDGNTIFSERLVKM